MFVNIISGLHFKDKYNVYRKRIKKIKTHLDTIGVNYTDEEWFWDYMLTGMAITRKGIAKKGDGGFKYEFPHGDRTDRFGISGSLPNQFTGDIFNEIVNKYDLSKEDAERILEFMKNYKPNESMYITLNPSNTLVVYTMGLGAKYGFGSGIKLPKF